MAARLNMKSSLAAVALLTTDRTVEARTEGGRALGPSAERPKIGLCLTSMSLIAGLLAWPQTLLAQESPHQSMTSAIVGATPGCPAFAWNIVRTPKADGTVDINGIVWLVDGSGLSSVRGVQNREGLFESQVMRVSGYGLSGSVTGQRNSDGSMDFKMVGEGCSNVSVHAAPGQTMASR